MKKDWLAEAEKHPAWAAFKRSEEERQQRMEGIRKAYIDAHEKAKKAKEKT